MSTPALNDAALGRPASGDNWIRRWMGPTFVALLLFLPAAIPFLYNSSSFAAGAAALCAAALALYATGVVKIEGGTRFTNELSIALLVPIVLLIHLFFATFVRPLNIERALQSIVLLAFMLAAVPIISRIIFEAGWKTLDKGVMIIRWMFVGFAILSILEIQPPTASEGSKPIFPFTEPSFFAFCFACVLIYTCVRANTIRRVLWIMGSFVIAFALQNLTMVVVCALAAVAALSYRLIALGSAVAIYVSTQIDLVYYQERLDLSLMSNNLSALVYLQGWQLFGESLRISSGWGLGFQQLGYGYTNVSASYRLYRLLGRDANLLDGGFLTAKLVSELGILGFALLGFLLWFVAKALLALRACAAGKLDLDDREVFAHSILLGSLVEFLVRGSNYFTGTTILIVASILFLTRIRKGDAQVARSKAIHA